MNTRRKKKGATRRTTTGKGFRVALVVSRFHAGVTGRLRKGAEECLAHHGVRKNDIEVFMCPGAFELPQVANLVCSTGAYHAVVCLGAVVRGETPHFEYVSSEAARGIQHVALHHKLPVTFGVLTTDTLAQAFDRAGGDQGNKGWDAAAAALEMATLFRSLKRRTGRLPVEEL